jgi:hypothetical protein
MHQFQRGGSLAGFVFVFLFFFFLGGARDGQRAQVGWIGGSGAERCRAQRVGG